MRAGINIVCVVLIIVLFTQVSDAQRGARMPRKYKVEAGIFFGASNYAGTLEENILNFNYTLPGYGAMIRYNFTNKFSLRFGMDYGTIEDADSSAVKAGRNARNLSFKTSILDGYLAGEYYFATWSDRFKKFSQLYVFGGIGSFHFNPQALYNGKWYNLQPLGTEGQGTQEYPNRVPYALDQVYIPFGLGARFTLSKSWFLNFEFRANKTFTDYLDDVSLTYASPDVLLAQGGPIAAALGSRTTEKYPTDNRDRTGTFRGNKSVSHDWFYFTGFTLCHTFIPKHHCYTF